MTTMFSTLTDSLNSYAKSASGMWGNYSCNCGVAIVAIV